MPTRPSAASGGLGKPPKRILWAEDNEGDRLLIRMALKETGNRSEVRFVADGPALLEALEGTQPDLVVLDLNMPGMHGIEVLQRMRAHRSMRDTPVAIFSSSTNPGELARCAQLGARHIVPKPMEHDAFNQAVASLAV
ncbi:MAG TPA: response regulator [Candidatus Thermoplasmatota archaeon]|nr:response regulator [Candidatus Thermoplasmatota archaeon]